MRTRQKLQRYTILLLLLVFTGTTLASAVNPGLASAAPYSSDSVQDKAKAWVLARAVSMCFAQESLDHNRTPGDDQIDEDSAFEGGWFEDEIGRDEGREIGEWAADLAEGDSDDAKATCRTSDLVPVALEALGWNNDAAGNTDALCSMGIWYREAGDDCREGAGWFRTSKGKGGDRSGAWSNAVRDKYFEGKGIEASLTPGMRYWILRESFIQECGDGEGGGLSINPYTDQDVDDDHEYKINWFNGTELEESYVVAVEHNHSHGVRIGGYGLFTDDDVYQCKTAADKMNEYAAAFAEEGGVDSGLGGSTNGTTGASLSNSCAGSNFTGITNLNWLFCPFIELTLAAANELEDQIAGMLCINESEIFGRNANITCNGSRADASVGQAFKEAWNVFRILAIGLLAIAGLVMILSQGLGFEFVDAYTIKRTLPRILIAAIGISLSWQLLQFLVTLSNALGIGIRSLIYAPFASANIEVDVLNGGAMAIGALFAAGGLLALGVLGVLSFLLTAALAILIAFFILVIRNILVILLILIAPVAIAMYILPNTEKYYKLWWEWLFKALMAFPIITAMIAVGHVFAAIASTRSDSTFSAIVAFLAYFAPYFLIPAAFRFAGGALATIGGFANNSSRGGFDRLKKFRGKRSEDRLGYYGQNVGDRVMQQRAEGVRRLNDAASKRTGVSAFAMRRAGGALAGLGGIEHKMSAINARTSKQLNDQIATGNDSDIRGLTVDRSMGFDAAVRADRARIDSATGKRQWKSLGGAWIDEADVITGQRKWGRDVAAQQAALSYEMRKAMTDEQVAGISDNYASLAQNQWGMTETQAGGSWIGASFENQNQHLEYKSTDWKTGALNVKKFSAEAYEKKGSYQLSQMSAHTIRQLEKSYELAVAEGDTESQDRIKAVAETFMHQMAGRMDDSGNLIPDDRAQQQIQTGQARRQVNSNGSGHVGEAVFRLAQTTGVMRTPPNNTASPGSPQSN